MVTFKEGRTPALWREYQALLPQCPENTLTRRWATGLVQKFRWVKRSWTTRIAKAGRWKLNAAAMHGDGREGAGALFCLADRRCRWAAQTVEEIAQKGGRCRWKVENEGFNRQKNSGLNLEHVYSIDPEKWKAYYLLLQIAFMLVQLLERGSLLRRLAEEAAGRCGNCSAV